MIGDRGDRAVVARADLCDMRSRTPTFAAADLDGATVAVEAKAGPVERALDQIATTITDAPVGDLDAQLIAALGAAALWRVVYEGAMREDDPALAALAAEQIRHAQNAYRGLIELIDARSTPPP